MLNKKEILFYNPAKDRLFEIWSYSRQWGDEHADNYIENLYNAIENKKEDKHHKEFPKTNRFSTIKGKVYFFLWKYNANSPSHTIFYRVLQNNKIGVIDIIGSRQNKDIQLLKSLKEINTHVHSPA